MERNEHSEVLEIIVDQSDNLIYLSDIDTYEMLFMNKALKDKLYLKESYEGKKCYELLQGLQEPCPYCTNDLLKRDCFYTWKHYNKHLNQYFELKDKLVEVNGKTARLEICMDITEKEKIQHVLERQLTTEETLVACVQTLSENIEVDTAIHKLLEIVGDFYQAERAYIFEIDYASQTLSNSYEWCENGIEPQIENLKNLPISAMERWVQLFREHSEVYINCLSDSVDKGSLEYRILQPQGIDSLMATPIWDCGELIGFIGVDNPTFGTEHIKLLRSITYFIKSDLEKRGLLHKLRELSYTDALTGLGNRNHYIDDVDELQKRVLQSLGVIFIDINGLKKANDQYGHQYGDRMIQNVANGIKKVFPENAYRIGGDEFVALLIDATKAEFDERLARLRKFEKEECICNFSLGVTFNDEKVHVKEQIDYSDDMMYVEKQVYYGRVADGQNNYHEALARELSEDIQKGVFEVYLQPKMHLDTDELVGAEALVRRKGENGEMILPSQFLPLYEAEGIIQYLDMFVFEQVCRMLCEWKMRGYRLIPISVNFSRVSLMAGDIIEQMARLKNSYQVEPGYLKIEVMEDINKINYSVLSQLIKGLEEEGLELSLDDYSGNTPNNIILTKMDFKEMKIDRSLVQDIVYNERARVILENSMRLGQDLGGMDMVASGIENIEQLDILKGFNFKVGQGFVFSKPMPMEEFEEKYAEKYLIKNE